MSSNSHEVVNSKAKVKDSEGKEYAVFVCKACPFTGALKESIEHAVANQYVVTSPRNLG